MKRPELILCLAVLAVNTGSLGFVLWWLYEAMTGPGGLFMMMILGLPLLLAGTMLAIKYRRDIRENPAAIFSALSTGCTYILLVVIPMDLVEHSFTATPRGSSPTHLLVTFGMLYAFLSIVTPLCRWLYRHSMMLLNPRDGKRYVIRVKA